MNQIAGDFILTKALSLRPLKLDECQMGGVNIVKLLGVIISSDLKWGANTVYITKSPKEVLPTMFKETWPVSSRAIECIHEFDTSSMWVRLSGLGNLSYYCPMFCYGVNAEAWIELI